MSFPCLIGRFGFPIFVPLIILLSCLCCSPSKTTRSEMVNGQPWDAEKVPIKLIVPAKKIESWVESHKRTIDPLREGPVRSDLPREYV